jgi:hypothetical protein
MGIVCGRYILVQRNISNRYLENDFGGFKSCGEKPKQEKDESFVREDHSEKR